MRKISIGNPKTTNTYRTNLDAQYVSGTTLTVLSNVSFAANDLAIIGEVGEELTELKQISSLTGKTTLNIPSALNFTHQKDTPVYKVSWDFVSIEGRSSSAGTFAELTQSPIQWDKLNTVYFHSAGTDTWQYRFRFLNSATSTYSEYSTTLSGSGFTRSSVGYMIREVRRTVGDLNGRVASDTEIIRFFNTAQDIIRGVKTDWSWLKVTDSTVTTVASQKVYALPSGLGTLNNLSDIRFNYNDNSTNNIIYALNYLSEKEFDMIDRDQNLTPQDYAQYYTIQEADSSSSTGYFRVYPEPLTTARGTFLIRYYKDIPDLDSVDDTTLVPIPSVLENFAIAQIEKIKGNENTSTIYENLFYGRSFVRNREVHTDTGINLLLKQDTIAPIGQPMSLVKYRGQKGMRRMFNSRYISPDYIRENYFNYNE